VSTKSIVGSFIGCLAAIYFREVAKTKNWF
jgi:hypothetical protein